MRTAFWLVTASVCVEAGCAALLQLAQLSDAAFILYSVGCIQALALVFAIVLYVRTVMRTCRHCGKELVGKVSSAALWVHTFGCVLAATAASGYGSSWGGGRLWDSRWA